jgi:hypothetical protein
MSSGPKMVRRNSYLLVHFSEEEKNRLLEVSNKLGVPMGALIRLALNDFLSKLESGKEERGC